MKKKTELAPTEDLNLVPIMNLVVCLIPMVLAGAALVKVGVVNVSAKSFGPDIHRPAPEVEPLELTLALAEDGFHIKAAQDLSDVLGTAALEIPKRGSSYDHVALYNALSAVKARYPKETVLQLSADPKVPYKHLIQAMDVIRFKLEADRYDDLTALQAAAVVTDEGQPRLLWHDVVFSVAL